MSIRLKILLCILSLEILAIIFLMSYKNGNCTTSGIYSYTTEQRSERMSFFVRQYNAQSCFLLAGHSAFLFVIKLAISFIN